jgi:hypothetical protein
MRSVLLNLLFSNQLKIKQQIEKTADECTKKTDCLLYAGCEVFRSAFFKTGDPNAADSGALKTKSLIL